MFVKQIQKNQCLCPLYVYVPVCYVVSVHQQQCSTKTKYIFYFFILLAY
jgi:hypothetical protein